MSPSATEILFILLTVGLMAAPPAAVAFFVWRKLYRRIDRLERELKELRDSSSTDDRGLTSRRPGGALE